MESDRWSDGEDDFEALNEGSENEMPMGRAGQVNRWSRWHIRE